MDLLNITEIVISSKYHVSILYKVQNAFLCAFCHQLLQRSLKVESEYTIERTDQEILRAGFSFRFEDLEVQAIILQLFGVR
jgi:hypothetical protein